MFPVREYGDRLKRFNAKKFYDAHSWIEYSVTNDSVFCFACRHFVDLTFTNKMTTFSQNGFNNWSHPKRIDEHNSTEIHKEAMAKGQDWEMAPQGHSIVKAFSEIEDKLIKENRHYLSSIAYVVQFLAKQGLAFRGHNENESNVNQGNFKELMHLIAKHDSVVNKKLHEKKNSCYTHHSIQNEIIQQMANMVIEEIRTEINNCGYFTIQADESKDISKQEQISIVVRYEKNSLPVEELIAIVPASEGFDSNSLSSVILQTLQAKGIDISKCVGQTFDGAAVMSGVNNGVFVKIRQQAPYVAYTHCFNHRINLVLVASTKHVSQVYLTFKQISSMIKRLIIFILGRRYVRNSIINIQLLQWK